MALGLGLFGTGVMGFVAPPVARALIDAVGWRAALVWPGAAPLVLALPPAWLFFHDGASADGAARVEVGAPPAFGDWRLFVLALAIAFVAMPVAGLIPNLIEALTSDGSTRGEAVAAASSVGIFVVVGRLGCGALVDRFWAPAVAATVVLASACACLVLAFGHVRGWSAYAVAAAIGLSAGAEFDLLPFLVSRYFAPERYTRTLGVLSSVFYLAAALGGPALGWTYDHEGTYAWGMALMAAVLVASAVGFLGLGRYPPLTR